MSKEIQTEITIAAPSALVFKAVADFSAYPSWNPYIRSIHGDGKKGGKIEITLQVPGSGRMRFKAHILEWDECHEIRWKGRLLLPKLFDEEYIFRLEEPSPGTVHFSQTAIYSGLLLPLFSKNFKKNREEGFQEMNAALKRLLEGQMVLEMESKPKVYVVFTAFISFLYLFLISSFVRISFSKYFEYVSPKVIPSIEQFMLKCINTKSMPQIYLISNGSI